MNTRWTWHNLKEPLVLVVGALLILSMFVLNGRVNELNSELDRANDAVVENGKNSDGGRALLCLQLKAQGQPVEKYEPCMRPQVLKLWQNEPIATLSERLCATGAMKEGCDGATSQNSP